MKRVQVTSSVIASVGYEPKTATLEIEFKTRRIYRYFDVPEIEHRNLMRAESLGKYFNRHIRNDYREIQIK